MPPLTSVAGRRSLTCPPRGSSLTLRRSPVRPLPWSGWTCSVFGLIAGRTSLVSALVNLIAHGGHASRRRPAAATPEACRLRRGVFRSAPAWLSTLLHRFTNTGGTSHGNQDQHPQHQVHDRDHGNQALLEGHIRQPSDPCRPRRCTPDCAPPASGINVTTLRIATNDLEHPEFHDVVLWRQQADFATKYMAKGRLAYIEGRLAGPHLGGCGWHEAPGGRGRRRSVPGDVAEAGRRCGGVAPAGSSGGSPSRGPWPLACARNACARGLQSCTISATRDCVRVDLTRSHVHMYSGRMTNTRIAHKAERQLILIDIENLTGTPSPTMPRRRDGQSRPAPDRARVR